MPIDERHRIRFHGWLLQHDLDEEVADAILATMPPYDWHELATKADLALLEHRIDSRFAVVDALFATVDGRFATVDGRFDQVDGRFDQVDGRFDQVDARFDQVGKSFDRLEQRVSGVAQEIRAVMFTLIGLIVSVLLAGAASMFG